MLGTTAAPSPGPSCYQPGVTGTFYELTKNQAQYLQDQFPFDNSGPGELFNTIKPAQTAVVPQLNFAAATAMPADVTSNEPSPWPHTPPENSNGTVALFDTVVRTPLPGFWTFFVLSSSPIELSVSQNGAFFEARKSGEESLDSETTIVGNVHEVQYDLPRGYIELHIEWHGGLPGDLTPASLLILEWAYIADPSIVPSPSPPQIPRQVVPARYMFTSCLAGNASGPAASLPVFSPPPPATRPVSPPPVFLALPNGPEVAEAPAPAPQIPGGVPDSEPCSANYTILGPYPQGSTYEAVLNLLLSATEGTINVPYNVTIGNPAYTGLQDAFNWEVESSNSSNGIFEGVVTDLWQTLTPNNSVNLGAKFFSAGQEFAPTILTLDGRACSISA